MNYQRCSSLNLVPKRLKLCNIVIFNRLVYDHQLTTRLSWSQKTSLSRTAARKVKTLPVDTFLWNPKGRESSTSSTESDLYSVSHFSMASLYFWKRCKAKCLRIRSSLIAV